MKRAMSTVKNIAAAAMTLAVFFGFAGFKPVTANAAQAAMPATASVEEENSYFEEDAYQRSFLTLINNERAQAGLAPVALGDSNHNAAAMERAEELAVSYSYVRPNGQRDFTVLAENGISDVSIGENYMAGCSTPDSAMDQWMATDFTRERILNADATTVSVGYYEGGVYNNYWVLIFSYPENSHTEDYRQEVLNLVNAQRAKYGLTALEMGDDALTAAAQTRAEEISVVNSHVRPMSLTRTYQWMKETKPESLVHGENLSDIEQQEQNKEARECQMAPRPGQLKVTVWIDGEKVPVLMKQEIKEYFDSNEYGNAYLLTVDMPKHPKKDLPYRIFKVELEDMENGDRGEGLYYMEKENYVQ